MKSPLRSSISLALISAVTAFSMAACFDPGAGEDRESTPDSDEADLGVATEAATSASTRISYWPGKVNVHVDPGSIWVKDSDCTSGSGIDPLEYCKRFYPTTTSITPVTPSKKPPLVWNTAGCAAQYSGNGLQEWICNP